MSVKTIERRLALVQKQREKRELERWKPRGYQEAVWNALEGGCKRVIAIWHRRAGKDTTFLHWTAKAVRERPGVYWHMLPEAKQARRVIWDGRTKEGKPFLEAFGPDINRIGKPGSFIVKKREDEMKLDFSNGSIWQCVGSDNFDSLMGANPIGIVLSEFAIGAPRAWDLLRPILAENGGWACFPYTPRGRNHGYDLYKAVEDNPDWFTQILTVDDTHAISLAAVQEERDAGMEEDLLQQEFYCSFDASLVGAYYAAEMAAALDEGRIGEVLHDATKRVECWFDLGIGDSTAIWFVQRVGQRINCLAYYENTTEGLAHYARYLQQMQQERQYVYGDIVWPHDGDKLELSTGETLAQTFANLGFRPTTLDRADIGPGIDKVRATLPRVWFDKQKCGLGIEALRGYRREYDERLKTFRPKPLHDWSSHGADAFRYGCSHINTYELGGEEIKYPNLGLL